MRASRAILFLLCGLLCLATTAKAQAPRQQPAAPAQQPPTTQAGGRGLDALDNDRVLAEIASRGLDELLRHAIQKEQPGDGRRRALLARISLNRLQSDTPLPTVERRILVRDVTDGMGEILAEIDDGHILFEQAQLLITRGVNEETRLLEYFGDNPKLREHLLPVTDAIAKMLERASDIFQQQADELAEQITSPNDAASRRWQQADAVFQRVNDYRVFAEYNRILAFPPGDPRRLRVADAVVAKVAPADNDQNPKRSFVQTYLGKVALARGTRKDREAARDYFERVIAASTDPAELFDAFYFRTVAEIEDEQYDAARAQLQRFAEWAQGQSLAQRQPLLLVLEYRIEDGAARYGPTDKRPQATARASEILARLVEENEEYRTIVTEQLLSRIEAQSDLRAMPPLLLDALVDRGRAEASLLAQQQARQESGLATAPASAAGREADTPTIERGIEAAAEMMRRLREKDPELDPVTVARNAFLRGLMLDILGRKIEAAEAFLDFNEAEGAETEQQMAALRRALGIIEALKQKPDGGVVAARVDALEGRLLPLLVGPPVNDKSRAFDLANRLHRLGQLDQAATYYRQVPVSDPRATDAAYLLLLAENARFVALPPNSPIRPSLAHELPNLGEAALGRLQSAMLQSEGAIREAYRERVARTRLILARLALLESRDPQAALSYVRTIEQDVAGLSEADEILSSALPLRFQATAMAGQIDQATQDLLTLLESSDARRGLGYISQFRETINAAMLDAERRGDSLARWQLMQTRAAVTPRLVEWIESKNDPEFQKYAYNFRRFDAETQYQAALMATDRADREARLRKALDVYRELGTEQNLQRYRELLETLSPEQRQRVFYDRDVVFAIGNIHYELGEHEEARSYYGRLIADRALGNPMKLIDVDGTPRQVSNDDYWELQLKFIRSSLALGSPEEPFRQYLRNQTAIYGEQLGGHAWRGEFARLRSELLGNEPLPEPATSPAEASTGG